jgi:hypothetical protein
VEGGLSEVLPKGCFTSNFRLDDFWFHPIYLIMAALTEHRAFLHDVLARQVQRRALVDPVHAFPTAPEVSEAGPSRSRLPSAGTNSKLNVANYVLAEETVRNDYCEWYGASGEWGSNYVLGAESEQINEEYVDV